MALTEPPADEIFDLGPTRLRLAVATEVVTVLVGELEPGAGAAPHTHTLEDETVVVVEGELVVDDGRRRSLARGDAHVLTRGTRHAFVNEGATVARVAFVCTPGGLERFFRDLTQGVPPDVAAGRAGIVLA